MRRSITDSIKRFDAYPKTLEDFRVQTLSGGTITVVSAIVTILLFASEFRDYLTPQIREELFVDTSKGEKLKINLDIVFSRIGCDYLGLDAMDVSGESHIDITHNIYKVRLDLNGNPIENPKREIAFGESAKIVNKTSSSDSSSVNVTCGSCYGAETPERKCCNTCAQVKDAYSKKSWNFEASKFDQCRSESGNNEEAERALKEGCLVYGYIEVNRVGGSFHVAPGRSFSINHIHVHDVQPFSSTDFNLTHRIRHLSFGRSIAGKVNPLDDVESVAEEGAMMYQYYIKIVPTTYVKLDDSVFFTNQYSVTRLSKSVSILTGESGMPGVFFNYELAPVMVKYSEREKSFGHFASGLCAIIGGIFTVAGVIDKCIYSSEKMLRRKFELGKGT